jgi:hypothetical protein
VAAVFGLAIVATVAWYHGDAGQQRITKLEGLMLIMLLAGGAVAAWYAARTVPRQDVTAARSPPAELTVKFDRRRLAVLPFANLSRDASNADFVSAVHDTLITQVARVPGLTVISRTSVLQYADKTPTVRDVATALRVGSVLEGACTGTVTGSGSTRS